MKKYDIFLFDADGTLFDFEKAAVNALRVMFESCGFEYMDSIWEIYRQINMQAWESYEKGVISSDTLKTIRFERLFDEIGVYHDPKEFNEKYLHELGRGQILIDGALEICKDITSYGKKIYIVTNGMKETNSARKNHSPLKEYITDFFVSELIGFQKPHISYFEHVFSSIPNFDKGKAIIIGDSLTADIAGGNNAGIDSCWLNVEGVANDTGIMPTYEIRELSEIRGFILQE